MSRRALHGAAASFTALGALAALGVALPAACFYPDYTFDEAAGDGGSGATPASSSTGPSSGGGPTTSSTGPASGGAGGGGNGGAPVGGGGAASSSSVGGNLGEICNNGVDDDRDLQVDCEDGECTDFSCVPAVPAGWTGYFAVYDDSGNDPGCPTDYAAEEFLGNKNLMAPPATCSACACAAPSGQTCVAPTTITINDAACGANETCFAEMNLGPANGSCFLDFFLAADAFCGPAGDCTPTGGGTAACNASVSVPPATVTGGMCAASGGTPSIQPVTWGNLGRACGDPLTTGLGCNVNQICLPRPPTPFEGGICIRQDGDVAACPANFANKHVFYGGATDTRGCGGCSCEAPSGGSCEVTVQVHSNNGCTSQVANLVTGAAGDCEALAPANPEIRGRKSTITKPPSGSTCNPAGGQPTGMATPTGAVTFCCTS